MPTTTTKIDRTPPHRDGLSLVEVLIAMTMTLIVLGAMMRAFNFASVEMTKGRAGLEMTNRLRAVQTLFKKDLQRLTVETKPYFGLAEVPKGYFELIEGPRTDVNALIDDPTTPALDENTLSNLAVGDYDDIWMGTIKSENRPFKGRLEVTDATGTTLLNVSLQKSRFAEVAWFTTYSLSPDGNAVAEPVDGDQIRLYRRQLLIDPTNPTLIAEIGKRFPTGSLAVVNSFFEENDFSVRVNLTRDAANNPIYNLVPNSLEDLAIRGNRFCHVNPFGTNVNLPNEDLPQTRTLDVTLLPNRLASNGEDVMLTGCIGFDLKVFSPDAKSLVQFGNPSVTTYQVGDYAKPSDIGATVVNQLNVAGGATLFVEDFIDGAADGDPTFFTSASQWSQLAGEYVDLGAANGSVQTLISPRRWSNPVGAFSKITGGVRSYPDAGILGRQPFPFVNPSLVFGGVTYDAVPAYTERVYDTGTSWYDKNSRPCGLNGIDDDGDGLVDEGPGQSSFVDVNSSGGAADVVDQQLDPQGWAGLDDVDNNGVLDSFEERIRPPYDVNLRGIQASIRVLERNAGQIRQLTVRTSLSPQ